MKRTGLMASLVGLTIVAGCASVSGQPSGEISDPSSQEDADALNGCELTELQLPEEADSSSPKSADLVSPSGEYVVGDIDYESVLWRDGEPEEMSDEIPSQQPIVGVNSSGMAVTAEGLLYEDGSATRLDTPEDTVIETINDAGDIIGNVHDVEGEGAEKTSIPMTPMKWEDGERQELELQSGNRGGALAVAEDGTVLGFQIEEDEELDDAGVPWIWTPDGEDQALPELDTERNALPTEVVGDWVLAHDRGDKDGDAYRWQLSNPDEIEELHEDLYATAIDDEGRVYGDAPEANGPSFQEDGELVELPDEHDSAVLHDVSADGSVAPGYMAGGGVRDIPIMWTCQH